MRAFRTIFAFLIAIIWIFAGWPSFFDFPPKTEEILALNQTANPDFASSGTGWTASNSTGTNTCGLTTSTNQTSFATFAFTNGDGNPSGSWQAVSGTGNNTRYKGQINQTFAMPGSGTVNVKGRMDYQLTGTTLRASNADGFVRLDIYDSANSTFVANLTCTQLPSTSPGWTTQTLSGATGLTGGTTYTIRVTLAYRNSGTNSATVKVDNIIVTAAPTGLSVSGPTNSKSAALSWTVSSAGSGANGLHATNPYKVYRDTSSPVSTFLANSSTNSYTDSSTVGNTTYYYAVSNVDTANIESPLSAEVSLLTKPDAPGTPTFSSVTDTSMTVSWTAPTGGSSTYDVERCTGSGCSSGWTTRSSAQAGTSFGDTGLSSNTTYGYRIVGNNATGAGVYSATAYQTTNTTPVYSVSITPSGTVEYGFVQISNATSTIGTSYTKTATNDGNTTEKLNVKSSDATGGTTWTLASAIGTNQFKHEFSTTTGSSWTAMTVADTYVTAVPSLAQSGTATFDFRLTIPSATSDYQQKSITITVQAAAP